MKMFNDIACNLNKWDANGCKNFWKFVHNYGGEKIILTRHFFIAFYLKNDSINFNWELCKGQLIKHKVLLPTSSNES
jgi:hypothetical protein